MKQKKSTCWIHLLLVQLDHHQKSFEIIQSAVFWLPLQRHQIAIHHQNQYRQSLFLPITNQLSYFFGLFSYEGVSPIQKVASYTPHPHHQS